MSQVIVDGPRVKMLRESLGLSQGQLAVKSGVGQSHISRLERGQRRNAHIGTVGKLASALSVQVDMLLIQETRKTTSMRSPRQQLAMERMGALKLTDDELIGVELALHWIEDNRQRRKRENQGGAK